VAKDAGLHFLIACIQATRFTDSTTPVIILEVIWGRASGWSLAVLAAPLSDCDAFFAGIERKGRTQYRQWHCQPQPRANDLI